MALARDLALLGNPSWLEFFPALASTGGPPADVTSGVLGMLQELQTSEAHASTPQPRAPAHYGSPAPLLPTRPNVFGYYGPAVFQPRAPAGAWAGIPSRGRMAAQFPGIGAGIPAQTVAVTPAPSLTGLSSGMAAVTVTGPTVFETSMEVFDTIPGSPPHPRTDRPPTPPPAPP